MQQQSVCSACKVYVLWIYFINLYCTRTIYMGCPLQRAKLLQTCSKTFTYRQRQEGRQLSNKPIRVWHIQYSEFLAYKHPCIHLRWMPNGYIGLYLFKVVHNISIYVEKWQHDSHRQHSYSYIFFKLGVFKWQDRSEYQLSRKRNKCRLRKENHSEPSASFFHTDHFINNWCNWFHEA